MRLPDLTGVPCYALTWPHTHTCSLVLSNTHVCLHLLTCSQAIKEKDFPERYQLAGIDPAEVTRGAVLCLWWAWALLRGGEGAGCTCVMMLIEGGGRVI